MFSFHCVLLWICPEKKIETKIEDKRDQRSRNSGVQLTNMRRGKIDVLGQRSFGNSIEFHEYDVYAGKVLDIFCILAALK
jgi:hypothetical protein